MSTVALALLIKYCLMFDVPVHVAKAVAKVESNYNNTLVGEHGEIGMFQILPENYPEANLKKLETNIKYGVFHLAAARAGCKHKLDNTYVVCYNLGIYGGSKIRHPKKFIYYRKVMQNVNSI